MSHWGKLIGAGFGYVLGDVLGAIVGGVLGYIIDRHVQSRQPPKFTRVSSEEFARVKSEFFTAIFSVMGYVARNDPFDPQQESSVAQQVMDKMGLPVQRREEALGLFEDGKNAHFSLQDMVGQFYIACRDQPNLLEMFIEIQIYAAYLIDGKLTPAKKQVILNVCYQLDMSHADFDRIERVINAKFRFNGSVESSTTSGARWSRKKTTVLDSRLEQAYAMLDASPDASNEEITRAYRRMTSRNHPDKLAGRGLSQDMVKMAEEKTRQIREAYEHIRESRNF